MSSEPVDVRVPGDKSITHRALILAALATGESRLSGLLDSGDTRSTARALRALGVAVPELDASTVRIEGKGPGGLAEPEGAIDCGNSGTTARLLLGVLAGCPFPVVLTGDDSLRRRPMRRVTEPLATAGARFVELEPPAGLPLRVQGRSPLAPLRWRSPVPSAQMKSALLLAGLTGGARTEVSEAVRSRDHTERMLRVMGARIETREDDRGAVALLEPGGELEPLDMTVPGDISSAFFFLARAALGGHVRVRDVGLNPGRVGALDVLRRMGCQVTVRVVAESAGEPVGSATVKHGSLRGTTVRAHEMPGLLDEVPALAVVAACARGVTRFEGVGELRVKESDRVAAVSENLRRLGVETDVGPDHLAVHGPARFRPAVIETRYDHRIAMAFGVLRGAGMAELELDDERVADISFPGFWERLASLEG